LCPDQPHFLDQRAPPPLPRADKTDSLDRSAIVETTPRAHLYQKSSSTFLIRACSEFLESQRFLFDQEILLGASVPKTTIPSNLIAQALYFRVFHTILSRILHFTDARALILSRFCRLLSAPECQVPEGLIGFINPYMHQAAPRRSKNI